MKKLIHFAILTITLLSPNNISAQEPTISTEFINSLYSEDATYWVVTSSNRCYIYGCGEYYYNYIGKSDYIEVGKLFNGYQIGNSIYSLSPFDDGLEVFNTSDCEPVTLSQYIPLKYAGAKGVDLLEYKMYIVPLIKGKYTITDLFTGAKLKLTNTYALILQKHDGSTRALVNIKKTSNGFNLSEAMHVEDKNGYTTNVISTSGRLLKRAIACNGDGECCIAAYWIKERPGFCLFEGEEEEISICGYVFN